MHRRLSRFRRHKLYSVKKLFVCIVLCLACRPACAATWHVGAAWPLKSIRAAFAKCKNGDSVIVHGGFYQEGRLTIDKSIAFVGKGLPVLDGAHKDEILSVKANGVRIEGFQFQHSGYSNLEDMAGVKVYSKSFVSVSNNVFVDNYFAIYLAQSKKCLIKGNKISAAGINEQKKANGIHCWKADSCYIIDNDIQAHRDGIYFEFVTNSIIIKNLSQGNIRYGLHFMFSHKDAYLSNTFRNNGAGVAVMFTREVTMIGNVFEQNWGSAAYGLLLKEISDSHIRNNVFSKNTVGILMEGTSRINIEKNEFSENGWAMKILASCMDNGILNNNFLGNTFDVSTNGVLVLNEFRENYWDKYEGYDLDRNNIGDVPYHPLSLYSVIVEQNPPAMLLFHSFIVTLLDKSEKILPTLTPDDFIDNSPLMHRIDL